MTFSPAISGGLIEAIAVIGLVALLVRFSPAISGGLIEARWTAAERDNGSGFSPAISGGLIEASLKSSTFKRRSRVFPRDKRGPH